MPRLIYEEKHGGLHDSEIKTLGIAGLFETNYLVLTS